MAPGCLQPEASTPSFPNSDGLNNAQTSELGRLSTGKGGLPLMAMTTGRESVRRYWWSINHSPQQCEHLGAPRTFIDEQTDLIVSDYISASLHSIGFENSCHFERPRSFRSAGLDLRIYSGISEHNP